MRTVIAAASAPSPSIRHSVGAPSSVRLSQVRPAMPTTTTGAVTTAPGTAEPGTAEPGSAAAGTAAAVAGRQRVAAAASIRANMRTTIGRGEVRRRVRLTSPVTQLMGLPVSGLA